MKKLLQMIAVLMSLLGTFGVIFVIFSDIQLLEFEEQQRLKEGKSFWEWHSDQGPLAMHYIEKGKGSHHILLLHGFRAHSYTWRALINPLAEAGYHVWAIDLIGYGFSDKPDHAAYTIDFFVQQIKDFMDAKNIQKVHVVGNSMGGGLALSLALAHSHRIESLTLLNALGYPLDLPFYLTIAKHINQIWIPFLGPTMVRYSLKQIVYNQALVSDEQVEAYSLPYRLPGGVTSSLLTLQKFDNQHLIEMGRHYPTLTSPALIIWGDHDRLIPVSHYEKFLKDFPHADQLLIPNCGHIPQEEEPEQVLAALLTFLQKIDSQQESKR